MGYSGPVIDKWEPYFEAYTRHFGRFRGKNVTMIEIGVQSGGSVLMWRHFFGKGLRYIGVDVNAHTQQFAAEWATIVIGDSTLPETWARVKEIAASADILLDDGGHTMDQQRAALKYGFPLVSKTGVFAVEDLHTSYWKDFGGNTHLGSVPSEKSFVDLSKSFVDDLHHWQYALPPPNKEVAEEVKSIHFYESIVLLEKGDAPRPARWKAGSRSIPYAPRTTWDGVMYPMQLPVPEAKDIVYALTPK